MSNIIYLYPEKTKMKSSEIIKRVPNHVRKQAAALMVVMQIPDGFSLVHLIGHGDECSNQRAIETWLMNNFTEQSLLSHEQTLVTLQNALTQHLNNQQGDFTC